MQWGVAVLCVVVTVYGCRERVASSEAAPPGDGNDVEASDAVRAEGVRRGGAAARDTAGASPPFFTDIAQAARLVFAHDAGVDGTYYLPEHLASGAALLDYDGDGDLDIYVINGADHAHRSDTPPVNRLFRREPDGTYLDRTAESGLGDPGYGMGVAVGDYDNDGFVDVYITNYGPDKLYRNSGDGTFTDVTAPAGIANARWSCSASFVDYDLDGFLDIYVGNYLYYPKPKPCTDGAGRPEYCGPQTCPPEPDVLFHNNGDGTFHDVSEPSGIASVRDRALGVVCDDFNGDDWPDIFVANDGGPNFLWINNRDGTFVQSSLLAGVAVNRFGAAEASMGVTVGDVDGDGDLDLFMTHLVHETNTLYRNVGAAGFQDVSAACGLGVSSLKYTGFGTAFFDFDHDGLLDLAVVNGRVRRGPIVDGADPASPMAAYAEPNLLYRNMGGGRFDDVTTAAGTFGTTVAMSRAMAVGDIDDDGDIDLLVANCHGRAQLFRNDAPKAGHWLIVRAIDPALHRDAYGARITLRIGERRLRRGVNPCYGYASSHDPRAHFGLGAADHVDGIEVRWPGGVVEDFAGVAADQAVTLARSVYGESGG